MITSAASPAAFRADSVTNVSYGSELLTIAKLTVASRFHNEPNKRDVQPRFSVCTPILTLLHVWAYKHTTRFVYSGKLWFKVI